MMLGGEVGEGWGGWGVGGGCGNIWLHVVSSCVCVCVVGSVMGSVVGSVMGSVVGSVMGTVVGSVMGSVVGSVMGSVVGSVMGSWVVFGGVFGSVVGSTTGSIVHNVMGSCSGNCSGYCSACVLHMVVVRWCVDVATVLVERAGQVALERVVVLLLLLLRRLRHHVGGTAAGYWRRVSIRLGSTLVAVHVRPGDADARVAAHTAEVTLALQPVLQAQRTMLRGAPRGRGRETCYMRHSPRPCLSKPYQQLNLGPVSLSFRSSFL
jgi:hypothetical protein